MVRCQLTRVVGSAEFLLQRYHPFVLGMVAHRVFNTVGIILLIFADSLLVEPIGGGLVRSFLSPKHNLKRHLSLRV